MIWLVIGLFFYCVWAVSKGVKRKEELREEIALIEKQRQRGSVTY